MTTSPRPARSRSAPPPPAPPAPGWWKASDGNWYPPETAPGAAPPAYGACARLRPARPVHLPAYGGAGYGYTPYVTTGRTNGMAIASLVLGILWLDWIGSVLAVIFGHIALSQIKRRQQRGRGLAIAGVTLGWIGIASLIVLVAVALSRS